MHTSTKLLPSVGAAIISCLIGCGGGGGASLVANTAPVTALAGIFLDGPVQGLHFDTATQHGDTRANGQFQYLPGESIVFSIGKIQFSATNAKPVITPLDIAGTTSPEDQRVNNMLVLLQSLDTNPTGANNILIPAAAAAIAPDGINFNVSSAAFRSNTAVTSFISKATSAGRTLVSDAEAQLHFQNSLNAGLDNLKINITPFANAGPSQSVVQGSTVNLDGRASGDANGDTLAYKWNFVSRPVGSGASLTDENSVKPSFVPDVAGDYLLGLVVSDGEISSQISVVKVSVVAQNSVPNGYVLVWSDEFNTVGKQLPDTSKWGYDISQNSVGWYNGELQYYANGRIQNSAVQNGNLVITARKENLSAVVGDWGGQSYTSARIFTKGKASWTYGFFEIRAKLPCSAGTWPAIWTLGSSVNVWPDQGEIDIMEQTGADKSAVFGTVHTLAGYGGNGNTGLKSISDSCTAFHNYQIKWTANAIEFYIDGNPYRPPYIKSANSAGWPFDKPQYLLLNIAVGGALGGAVDEANLSSTGMEIDYVRVYQAP